MFKPYKMPSITGDVYANNPFLGLIRFGEYKGKMAVEVTTNSMFGISDPLELLDYTLSDLDYAVYGCRYGPVVGKDSRVLPDSLVPVAERNDPYIFIDNVFYYYMSYFYLENKISGSKIELRTGKEWPLLT